MSNIKNNLSFFRNNLIQLFSGCYFNNSILNKIISKIEMLFVCGNLIHPHDNVEEYDRTSYVKTNLNKVILKYLSDGMRQADEFFDQLCKIISLGLLPGEFDATNACYPQEKFKSFTLNKSSNNSNFTLLDNPSIMDYRNYNIAITSGQNIKSMMRYTDYSAIDSIVTNFNSSHYAINYPDDLR